MARTQPHLPTFTRAVEALYSEALRCLAEVDDKLMHHAWHQVAAHLADAVLAAENRCPVCGEREAVACPHCPVFACAGCQYDAHFAGKANAPEEHGNWQCPKAPRPEPTCDDDTVEDDITW